MSYQGPRHYRPSKFRLDPLSVAGLGYAPTWEPSNLGLPILYAANLARAVSRTLSLRRTLIASMFAVAVFLPAGA